MRRPRSSAAPSSPRPPFGAALYPRLPRCAGWALAVALLGSGCPNPAEPAACLDQRVQARNLALAGDIEQAQALLDRVKAECGPNSAADIQHVTKLIAEKSAARREKERLEQSQSELLQKFPSRAFVEWATARGGDIRGKLHETHCAARGTPDFGFCEGQRSEAPGMSLRYWQAQPEAYRYALATTLVPSCQDLGQYRQVRTWSRDGSDFELCELTDRRLRQLSALIVHAPSGAYEMYIFSQDYPAIDAEFERRLRTIPEPR